LTPYPRFFGSSSIMYLSQVLAAMTAMASVSIVLTAPVEDALSARQNKGVAARVNILSIEPSSGPLEALKKLQSAVLAEFELREKALEKAISPGCNLLNARARKDWYVESHQ
jgi:hypothetical protein